jgi:hypothetical protein
MTLFRDKTGPMIKYEYGVMHIRDLNPEHNMTWRMTRMDMFRLGFKCLLASLRRVA